MGHRRELSTGYDLEIVEKTPHQFNMEIESLQQRIDTMRKFSSAKSIISDRTELIFPLMERISREKRKFAGNDVAFGVLDEAQYREAEELDPTGMADLYKDSVKFSLHTLLQFAHFLRFVEEDPDSDPSWAYFWLDVEDFKRVASEEERKRRAVFIYQRYILPDSEMYIKFPERVLSEMGKKTISRGSFDDSQDFTFTCLVKAYYDSFVQNRFYSDLLKAEHGLKFKLFGVAHDTGGEAYNPLLKLLLDPKCELISALSEVSKHNIRQLDMIGLLAAMLFHQNDMILHIMKKLLVEEIHGLEVSEQQTLFRSDSVGTKVYYHYSRLISTEYLMGVLSAPLHEIMGMLGKSKNFEIDPQRIKGGSLKSNMKNLKYSTQKLVDRIAISEEEFPKKLRIVCAFVQKEVIERMPRMKYQSVGNFVFLRLVNPCLVAPDRFGIVDQKSVTLNARRAFILISKIMQNLSNRTLFKKEAHMFELNEFLTQNQMMFSKFFDRLTSVPATFASLPKDHIPVMNVNIMRGFHYLIVDCKDALDDVLKSSGKEKLGKKIDATLEKLPKEIVQPDEFLPLVESQFDLK